MEATQSFYRWGVHIVETWRSQRLFDAQMPPQEQRWRLFIDWNKQRLENPLVFDQKNPGYYAAMMDAFQFLRDTLGQRMTSIDLCALHDRCVHLVQSDSHPEALPMRRGFFAQAHYGIQFGRVTKQAKRDWERYHLICTHWRSPECGLYLSFYMSGMGRIYSNGNLEEISHKVDEIFDKYYRNIALAQSEDGRLAAIVNVCRFLEIFHVFPDGNQRTIANVLLTKLLLENGLSLTILSDPAMFDGYFSTREMMRLVRRGQKRYQQVISHFPL